MGYWHWETGELRNWETGTTMVATTVVLTATDSMGSTTTSVTFPMVSAAASGPTWTTPSAPASLQVGSAISSINLR